MSNVGVTLRPAASQSGMYIRSRMSFHLVLSVDYEFRTCMTKVNLYCDQRRHGDCRINCNVKLIFTKLVEERAFLNKII